MVLVFSAGAFLPAISAEKEGGFPGMARVLTSYDVYKNIDYLDAPVSESQKLDLYVPKKLEKSKRSKPALVVWIHGGGWKVGDKRRGPFFPLLKKGFAVASINYRLSPEAKFPAQIHDCKSAVIWLKKNASKYNYDPLRVGVWGASAGGHLSALLGATTGSDELDKVKEKPPFNSDVNAVCDWFGPTDLLKLVKYDKSKQIYDIHPLINELLGQSGVRMVDAARLASPVTYIKRAGPPTLIIHGDRDKLVPIDQSKILYEKLKSRDCDVTIETVRGGHGFPGFGSGTRAKVVQFFERTLN